MRVLVACECSGRVRRAFRGRGIDAWSNDLKPAEDGSPYHIQADCMDVIQSQMWDTIIMHPDCTALALSGNRWYGKGMPLHHKRLEAIEWTLRLWETARKHSISTALENPKSVIFPLLKTRVHYIQPHQFGHPNWWG